MDPEVPRSSRGGGTTSLTIMSAALSYRFMAMLAFAACRAYVAKLLFVNNKVCALSAFARHSLPSAPKGATIGLFGGSFDPAHEGHAHVTRHALRAFGLDRVWWLVSPGNPLKANGPAPMAQRVQRATALMSHPRVTITTAEARLGTRYTADTLRRLMQLYPDRRFVWIMGADNLAGFHHWENWRWIMQSVPVAVIARPGQQRAALSSVAARAYAGNRILPARATQLATLHAPTWCYVTIPMRDISSTQLRAAGFWG